MSQPTTVPFAEPLLYSLGSGRALTPSHLRLRDEVKEYVNKHIIPYAHEWERKGDMPASVRKRHASLGYAAVLLDPRKVKGFLSGVRLPGGVPVQEWDSFHQLICSDEIARCGFLGTIWALGAGNTIGVNPLLNFGTEEQHRRFIPGIISGDISFSLGITEPDAGCDVAAISTIAAPKDGYFEVTGTKKWVTNGMWADYCTAAVRTSDQPGRAGISTLIIPLNLPGVTRTFIETSGVAPSGCALLEFEKVKVPAENLLGPLDGGFAILMSGLNANRLSIATNCLGLARTCLEEAYLHASTRKTFGKTLLERPTVQQKFVTMGLEILPTSALLEKLLAHIDSTTYTSAAVGNEDGCADLGGLCALTKVSASRTLELVSRECLLIMGGIGFTRTLSGQKIEQVARDHKVLTFGGGSEDVLMPLSLSQEKKDLAKRIKQQEAAINGSALAN